MHYMGGPLFANLDAHCGSFCVYQTPRGVLVPYMMGGSDVFLWVENLHPQYFGGSRDISRILLGLRASLNKSVLRNLHVTLVYFGVVNFDARFFLEGVKFHVRVFFFLFSPPHHPPSCIIFGQLLLVIIYLYYFNLVICDWCLQKEPTTCSGKQKWK